MDALRSTLHEQIEDDLEPHHVARLVSDILYSSNFMCTPVIAGFGSEGPFLCSMDGLGAQTVSNEFVALGSSSSALLSTCETIYTSDCDPSTVLDMAQLIIRKALQRDVLSGCKISSYTFHKNNSIYRNIIIVPDV